MAQSFRSVFGFSGHKSRQDTEYSRLGIRFRHSRVPRFLRERHQVRRTRVRDEIDWSQSFISTTRIATTKSKIFDRNFGRQLKRNNFQNKMLGKNRCKNVFCHLTWQTFEFDHIVYDESGIRTFISEVNAYSKWTSAGPFGQLPLSTTFKSKFIYT